MPAKTLRIPKTLFREATFDRSAVNEEERTVELSISSDAPYERFFGYEILDHKKGSVNMERMESGAPLLFNHNRDLHIGTIVSAKLDGKALRVVAKIGENSDAENRWADIKSGVLQKASVGYSVDAMVLEEEKKDGPSTYRITSWTPFEGSLVTIPADFSVGVGRSDERAGEKDIQCEQTNLDEQPNTVHKPITQPTRTMPEATPPAATIDPTSERNAAVAEFKSRCQKIDGFVAGLKNEQWKTAAAQIANKHKNGDANFEDFRAEALDAFEGVTKITADSPEIGMSSKEVKRFSLLEGVRSMIHKGRLDGFEKEVCEAARAKMGRQLPNERTFIIPEEVSNYQRALAMLERAGNVGTFTAGGALVENEYGTIIEFLRNQMVLGRLGITMLGGIRGDFVMPQQTGGCTAYWVSETGTITDSQATFAQKVMTPHRVGACYPFTMQFLAQSSTSVDAFVRNELDTVIALKKDLAGLLGSGVGGEPLGVANTTGINATVTYGGAATWADVVEHETGIAVDNADIGTMGFALDAASVGKWKTILKDSVAGAGYLIADNMTANGYKVERTNQISTAHQSFFGVWSQLIHAMWAGREVTVDSVTLAKQGQHQIIINELCDFLVRQPLAFNVSTDSAAQ